MKIKVCGMRDPENIKELVKLQPDFIGFILYPGSKRYVGNNYTITTEIPASIKKVGVFVNSLIKDIVHWNSVLNFDYVQLHGNEPPEYCSEIRNLGLKIIKSFGVSGKFDFDFTEDYLPYCEYFLFDTQTSLHGGSGLKFDWNILNDYKLNKPFFLSGGIQPEDSIILSHADVRNIFALDINSGFEISPGLKDISLVDEFLKTIRSDQKVI